VKAFISHLKKAFHRNEKPVDSSPNGKIPKLHFLLMLRVVKFSF